MKFFSDKLGKVTVKKPKITYVILTNSKLSLEHRRLYSYMYCKIDMCSGAAFVFIK